jgi:hypothetical protein
MKELFQTLQDAFPVLRSHPLLMARLFLLALLLVGLYSAKGARKKICGPLFSKLCARIFVTSRWLYVYQDSNMVNDWKYYTSEVTGKGEVGDDVIWTLVRWPSLKPKDSFRVSGAVGMVNGIHESQAKLQARWKIAHDPDSFSVGPVPARGLISRLRRASAKMLQFLGAVDYKSGSDPLALEENKTLLDKDKELYAALGPGPEVVLEYECSKRNPLTLRNLRGWTAYHVKIEDIVIEDRCTATFEELSHLAEGASVRVLPFVQDRFVKPDLEEWKDVKDDFLHALECAYQTWGHDFDPVRLKMFVSYADRNGRKYRTECELEFDRFRTTAIVKCDPPKPVT